MGSSIFSQAAEFLRENKTAKRALGIMVCLALLVALGTVGVLTSTGQAMTKKVVVLDCAYRVHAHTADCYDEEGNLTCGQADYVVHVHNEDCYDESGALVCPLAERAPHTHTDACWKEVSELTCGQEEDPGHTHGESCYQYELGELTCVKPEHTHSDECYTTVEVLSCDKPEHTHSDECLDPETGDVVCGLEEHTHGGSCYTQERQLACGLEEHTHNNDCYQLNATLICTQEERPAGHIHTDACYTTEKVLACGELELHTHDDSCYDESGALICGQLELLEHVHSGDCLKTVEVQVADESGAVCGLVEHTHTDECFDPETGEAICGYVEHTHTESCFPAQETPEPVYVCGLEEHTHSDACYDENGALTCGLEEHTHTDACLAPAEGESEAAPETFCGLAEHTHDESCYNEAGELVCTLEEHTHTEDCFVKPVTYYCGLEEHTHSAECYDETGALICGLEEHTHTDACLEQILIQTAKTEDGSILVTAAYGPEANLPESAVLQVKRIQPEGADAEHYEKRVAEADEFFEKELAESEEEYLEPLALLNLGFFTQDGLEVQPNAPVTVTVRFLDESGAVVGDPLTVIHLAETGAEALETSALDAEQATVFTTDGFSDFVVGKKGIAEISNDVMMIANGGGATNFEHSKRIDYLGDNTPGGSTDNGDTDADSQTVKDDLYRLYLDMTGDSEPIDLVIVIDRSDSMSETMKGGKSRWQNVYNILEGTEKDGSDGLLYQFLKPNEGKTSNAEKNWVSVVWFAGAFYDRNRSEYGNRYPNIPPNNSAEGGTVLKWTASYTKTVAAGHYDTAPLTGDTWGKTCTNYVAGLWQADNKLNNRPAGTEKHKQVVIFMSDGVPVYYYMASDMKNWDNPSDMKRYGRGSEGHLFTDFASGYSALIGTYMKNTLGLNVGKDGRASAREVTQFYYSPYMNETLKIFNNNGDKSFTSRHPNINFYTVGIDLNSTIGNGWQRTTLLKDMAASYTNGAMFSATSASELKKHLQQIMFPAGVTINDTLSDYVDLYDTPPDIKVTATNKTTKAETVLWSTSGDLKIGKDNAVTGNFNNSAKIGGYSAKQILSSVTYNKTTKKISANFVSDYCFSKDYIYTLSFNVQLTEAAYDAYASGSYPNTGAGGTDYPGNGTSSTKPGLNSNADSGATAKFTINKKESTLYYDHPVVQAWGSKFGFTKISTFGNLPLEGMYFRLERANALDSANDTTFVTANAGKEVKTATAENGTDYYLTDDKGTIDFGYLLHGSYTLYEYIPEGYVGGPNEVPVLTFKVQKGRICDVNQIAEGITWTGDKFSDITTVVSQPNKTYGASAAQTTIKNEPIMEEISFYKQDKDGNSLQGAKFQLYRAEQDPSGAWKDVGDPIDINGQKFAVSNEEGVIFTMKIPYGDYVLVETEAPAHYDELGTPVHFKVDNDSVTTDDNRAIASSDGDTLTLIIKNHRSAVAAKLIKVDASTHVGLDGAEFTLYEDKDCTKELWVGTSHKQLEGALEGEVIGSGKYAETDFPLLDEGVTYYLKETVTPAGYNTLTLITLNVEDSKLTAMADGQIFVADLGEDNVYTITLTNNSGFVLPRSGGEGTAVYILSGAALVTLAGSLLLLKRKKEREA